MSASARRLFACVCVAGCLIVPWWAGSAVADDGLLSIAGSSTVQPIVTRAAKQYQEQRPEVRIVVGGGGSSHGIQAVAHGDVQAGMASRALKPSERDQWPALRPTRIGLAGVALVVHASSPVRGMTSAQVRDVFTGKIANWRQLGGPDASIVLITTNERHGTFDAFCEYFDLEARPEGQQRQTFFRLKGTEESSGRGATLVDGNGPALAAVVTKPHAVSYASLGAALRVIAQGGPVKMLPLDGVTPTEQAVRDGTYRLQRPLLMITRGEPAGEVARFLAYLSGPEGQQIVREMDCLSALGE
jgi:phosphate transport system substrate-binding protein